MVSQDGTTSVKIRDVITEDSQLLNLSNQATIDKLEKSYQEVSNVIKMHCQPYLAEIGGVHNALFNVPLYRGVQSQDANKANIHNPLLSVDVRMNRQPKDTPLSVHHAIDEWFYYQTGYKFRSAGLFCTGRRQVAASYGGVCIVVPAGEFHYCWSSRYQDLYSDMEEYTYENYDSGLSSGGIKQQMEELFSDDMALNDFLADGQYQVDNGLIDAIGSKSEIMIVCKSAYLVNIDWCNAIERYLPMR
ncbi:MAG TPA: hypothetical protein VFM18_17235 [Methanosarcina sp.]|nr:hypothetical protein [Methanosarcina sp.]